MIHNYLIKEKKMLNLLVDFLQKNNHFTQQNKYELDKYYVNKISDCLNNISKKYKTKKNESSNTLLFVKNFNENMENIKNIVNDDTISSIKNFPTQYIRGKLNKANVFLLKKKYPFLIFVILVIKTLRFEIFSKIKPKKES